MSNTKKKISIITPVYNREKFLPQCIDSVLNQTFLDWELICINDGSTDSSLSILNEYAANDERIKIIDKVNEGQGMARNLALGHANGDYVLYLDSDDWLEPGSLELLYEKISNDNADITIFNAAYYNMDDGKKTLCDYTASYRARFEEKVFSPTEACEILFDVNGLPFKIYNRKFLVDNEIKYSNHRFIEDSAFIIKAMLFAKKISCLNRCVYNMRHHCESTSSNAYCFLDNIYEVYCICRDILFSVPNYAIFTASFIFNRVRQMNYYYWLCEKEYREKYYHLFRAIIKDMDKKIGIKQLRQKPGYYDFCKCVKDMPYPLYCLYKKFKKTYYLLCSY